MAKIKNTRLVTLQNKRTPILASYEHTPTRRKRKIVKSDHKSIRCYSRYDSIIKLCDNLIKKYGLEEEVNKYVLLYNVVTQRNYQIIVLKIFVVQKYLIK